MDQDLKPRVPATISSRWIITPLFYSRSTDLPVLGGRRYVDGAPERPQTGGLYNKFAFQALRLWDGPDNRPGRLPHWMTGPVSNSRLVCLGTHYLANLGKPHRHESISPCTISMDHDAIICFMTDRLTRAPDADVHVPSVGSPKHPSRRVDVIYL